MNTNKKTYEWEWVLVWRFNVCCIWAKRDPGAGGKELSARVGTRLMLLEAVKEICGIIDELNEFGDLNLCWGDRGEGNSGVSGLGTFLTGDICFAQGDDFFSISFNLKYWKDTNS